MSEKKRILVTMAAILAMLSSCIDSRVDRTGATRFEIEFPEPPVELFDNEDAGKQVINYFNIVQTDEKEYRMYYIAVENGVKLEDFAHNLYVAWSEDLIHWKFENPLRGSNLIMENIVEQSVNYNPKDKYPYRLTGNVFEDGRYKLCMWKSKDGISFTDRKVVLEDMMHDSQCVVIPEKDFLKLYYRQSIKLGPGNYDRRIVLRYLDLEGNPITDMEFIADDYLYNSAASKIDDDFDLLLPTEFNNAPGMGDACRFRAFIQHGFYSQSIDCPLNDWMEEGERWFLAAPGFITHEGKTYIAYNARNTSHDQGCVDHSCYKLIEIQIHKRCDQEALNPHINESKEGIQTGDLLFVGRISNNAGNGIEDAIAAATGGEDEIDFIHTAILEVDDEGKVWVIDATIKHGVDRHPLDTLVKDFTSKHGNKYIFEVKRLPDNRRASEYISNAKKYLGEDYDQWFLPDNGKHYCTELVEDSYKSFGVPVFKPKPMNFKDRNGEYPEYWKKLFASLGQDIPQGVKGTNPQDMYSDVRLQRVAVLPAN